MKYLLTQEELGALVPREKLDEMAKLRDVAVHVALALMKLVNKDEMCIHDPALEFETCCDDCPLSAMKPTVGGGISNKVWRNLPSEIKEWIEANPFAKVCGMSRNWSK